VPDVESYFDDMAAEMALHKLAVGATEKLREAGNEGPYDVLVCGSRGEIFGRFAARTPMRFGAGDLQDQSDGCLNGLQAFHELG
jgi:hypothetical protein